MGCGLLSLLCCVGVICCVVLFGVVVSRVLFLLLCVDARRLSLCVCRSLSVVRWS